VADNSVAVEATEVPVIEAPAAEAVEAATEEVAAEAVEAATEAVEAGAEAAAEESGTESEKA
ncbi:MAG: hypothetical protein JJE50_14650, partial [Actinomycetales bacterium]|nr:hypothetical protein [Actinomycetales bacterium]